MKNHPLSILLVGIFSALAIGFFLSQENLSFSTIFLISFCLFMIITLIFENRGYHNKTYYLLIFISTALMPILFAYAYLFVPSTYTGDFDLFFAILYTLSWGLIFSRDYIKRKNNTKMPWKDEWEYDVRERDYY